MSHCTVRCTVDAIVMPIPPPVLLNSIRFPPDDLVKTPGNSPRAARHAGRRSGRRSAYHIASSGSPRRCRRAGTVRRMTTPSLPPCDDLPLGEHCTRQTLAPWLSEPGRPHHYRSAILPARRRRASRNVVAGQAPARVVGRGRQPGRTGCRPARVRTADRISVAFAQPKHYEVD